MTKKNQGLGKHVVSTFAKERNDKKVKKKRSYINIFLTIVFILVASTMYLHGCTSYVEVQPKELNCQRINDREIVCKNV